jgi:hypothetical protein
MNLDPQLPQLPTLTLDSILLNVPPNKPANPQISMLFSENTPYKALNNPVRGAIIQKLQMIHKEVLQEALSSIRVPFIFQSEEPLMFEGANVGSVSLKREVFYQ